MKTISNFASSFLAGLVLAALLVGLGFVISGKRESNRYQLIYGKVLNPGAVGVADTTIDVVMRIDTVTGQTWTHRTSVHGDYWDAVTDDPLLPKSPK